MKPTIKFEEFQREHASPFYSSYVRMPFEMHAYIPIYAHGIIKFKQYS